MRGSRYRRALRFVVGEELEVQRDRLKALAASP